MNVDFDFIFDTADKIGLNAELTKTAAARITPRVLSRAEKVKSFNRGALNGLSPIDKLAAVLSLLKWTKGIYDEKGIPSAVFYDTMTDITIWCHDLKKRKNRDGLKNTGWIINHLNADIFRIGRLQFQFTKFNVPVYASSEIKQNPPLERGTPCLYVHIPEGGPLTPALCDESFSNSKEFFKRYFPEYNYKAYISESWLYYPQNAEFMAKSSNILNFSARFNVIASVATAYAANERIWDRSILPHRTQNTSLQRAAYMYVKSGGKLGVGFGIILL